MLDHQVADYIPREHGVDDWNLVISVYQDGFRPALRALRRLGTVERSPYHNVLVMKVDNPTAALDVIERETEQSTALYDSISRVAPAMRTVDFRSAAEFLEKLKPILIEWSSRLNSRSLHVRLRRRGGQRDDLRTTDAERLLDDLLLDTTAAAGSPCTISFTHPDAIIAIDIIDDRAGVGLWTSEDLAHHRLLRPD